jgi:hypothetical protein
VDRQELARLEGRRRRHGGHGARCTEPGCHETDSRALTGAGADVLCAEHRAIAAGRSWTELQHVAGRHNDGTVVPLPANWHAALTHEQQTAWPRAMLRNPDADPLLRVGACIRGSRETIGVILDRALGSLDSDVLEFRKFVEDEMGPDWPDRYRAWQQRHGC